MYTLGIDIGGTKCAVVLGHDRVCDPIENTIVAKKKFDTDVKRGWKKIVGEIISVADEILKENGIAYSEIKGIGISCGGPLNPAAGTIHCPPNLPDWDSVPITKIISEHFGVNTLLQNDANACALAEWKFGAGRGTKNMMFLTFGTGMGAGIILDGRLYSGTNGLAGEVGHIRLAPEGPLGYGKHGSFEGFCSGGGLADLGRMYIEKCEQSGGTTLLNKENLTAKSIAQAVYEGDETAKSVYRECAVRLGQALAVFIDILNPEAIVIGSIFTRNEKLFRETVEETVKKEALPEAFRVCKILPAQLNESIGDFAALGLVI